MIIHTAYGSQRHLGSYKELGLQSDQIYIHGRKSRKHSGSHQDCQVGNDILGWAGVNEVRDVLIRAAPIVSLQVQLMMATMGALILINDAFCRFVVSD